MPKALTAEFELDLFSPGLKIPPKPSSRFHVPVPPPPRSPAIQDTMNSGEDEEETGTMLCCDTAKLNAMRAFASLARCPHCGDLMVAPVASEFVAAGEIRHHWECDACGERSHTAIRLTAPDE